MGFLAEDIQLDKAITKVVNISTTLFMGEEEKKETEDDTDKAEGEVKEEAEEAKV